MTYPDRYEAALRAMPATAKEIAERLGVLQYSVDTWTAKLRKMGWAHVGDWKQCEGSGHIRPVIYGGPGKDVPKPPAISEAVRLQRERVRDRQRYARKVAKKRADAVLASMQTSRRASPFAALGI